MGASNTIATSLVSIMPTARRRFRTSSTWCLVLLAAGIAALASCDSQAAATEAPSTLIVGFVGAPHHTGESAARGAMLGAEEAARTGALLGREFGMRASTASSAADAADRAAILIDGGVSAIVGGFDDATCAALDSVASRRGVVFMNIGCRTDAFRRVASTSTFHVAASDSMYARELSRAVSRGGAAPVLWHAGLSRYGAGQLNQRFIRRFGVGADADAWAAWMAMKLLWEASAPSQSRTPSALAVRLLEDDAEFDGHKGEPLRFDPSSRQLRQPLMDAPQPMLESGSARVAASFADSVTDAERSALARAYATRAPLLIVTNEGSADVMVLDADSGEVLAVMRFAERPRGVQTTSDGRRAWIALSDESPTEQRDGDAIVELDLVKGRVVARHIGGSDPEQFAISDDARLLVASNEDAGTATLLDLRPRGRSLSMVVGIEPEGVALSPDARWAYVTAETSNTVSVIDTRSERVVASFLVDERPRAAAFAPDGKRAYVSNEISGTLSVIDVATHSVQHSVQLASGRAKPVGVVVSPDSRWVFVANGHAHSVSVVDAQSLREVHVIDVERRPWGLAMSGDGARLYVANGGSNSVSVIDTRRNAVIATYPVGSRPWGVAVTR